MSYKMPKAQFECPVEPRSSYWFESYILDLVIDSNE